MRASVVYHDLWAVRVTLMPGGQFTRINSTTRKKVGTIRLHLGPIVATETTASMTVLVVAKEYPVFQTYVIATQNEFVFPQTSLKSGII